MAACALDGDVEPVGSVVWPAGVAAISALERLSNARRGGFRVACPCWSSAPERDSRPSPRQKFGARVVATDASELCLRLLRRARRATRIRILAKFVVDGRLGAVPCCGQGARRNPDLAWSPLDALVRARVVPSTSWSRATRSIRRRWPRRRRRGSLRPVATARLVLDPCRPTRPQFVDELKRLEVASWDGGADVAFRPLPVDAGAVRFDGDASDEQFSFDGCYAAGRTLPPGLFRCCIVEMYVRMTPLAPRVPARASARYGDGRGRPLGPSRRRTGPLKSPAGSRPCSPCSPAR